MNKQTQRLRICGPWELDELSLPCHQHHHCHHSCCLFPTGCSLPGARRCELFQVHSSPASTAIEFCFHYAGFLGSFKLISILSSLLRPLKRAVFPPSLVHWGLYHFTRPAPSLARAVCPSSPASLWQASGLPDFQAVGCSPPGHWQSMPSPQQPGQRPLGSDEFSF